MIKFKEISIILLILLLFFKYYYIVLSIITIHIFKYLYFIIIDSQNFYNYNLFFSKKILQNNKLYEKIPKIIHKVFINDNMNLENLPEGVYEAIQKWKELNPEYELKLWSGNDCRKYIENNFSKIHLYTWDNIVPYSGKCNFFRYCIISKTGGWYSDLKQYPYVSLNEINNDNYDWISFWDKGTHISYKKLFPRHMQPALFGATKNHPVLLKAIDICIYNTKNLIYGFSPQSTTGPGVFGKAFNETPNNKLGKIKIGVHYNNNFYLKNSFCKNILNACSKSNNTSIVQQKFFKCSTGQDWKNGNNYATLWDKKKYYLKDN